MILSIIQNFWTGLISLSLNRLIRQLTLVNYKFSLKSTKSIYVSINQSKYLTHIKCGIRARLITMLFYKTKFFLERFVQNIAKKHSKPPFNDQKKFAISFHYDYLINIQVYTPLWMQKKCKNLYQYMRWIVTCFPDIRLQCTFKCIKGLTKGIPKLDS